MLFNSLGVSSLASLAMAARATARVLYLYLRVLALDPAVDRRIRNNLFWHFSLSFTPRSFFRERGGPAGSLLESN